jgi:hypothetical protein
MPGKGKLPPIMDKAVKQIKKSSPGVNPYAVASATLQKAGELKPGTNKPTSKGTARGQMTGAQRHRTQP